MDAEPHARAEPVDLRAELVAVVVAVDQGAPAVLASGTPPQLPAGALRTDHHSLQAGVRAFAEEQTGYTLGYVEQLYTFADLGRLDDDARAVSISYLGLTRAVAGASGWSGVYELLPWEDRRQDADGAEPVSSALRAAVLRWVRGGTAEQRRQRADRCAYVLGLDGHPWRPELALQRYELLWEAGLVGESPAADATVAALTGQRMLHDHRRILATGLSRLRSALQYRPMVFELMPDTFTLGQLQETVEALAGQEVHKQNFRRVVEQQHRLVEPTEDTTHATGGRPARLYRFRREVFRERQQVGTKLPLPRAR